MQSPFLSSPLQLAVDPLRLVLAGRPSTDSSRALRAALPSLEAAWLAASHVLFAQRTGLALQDSGSALRRALDACVAELDGVSAALESAAAVYGHVDGVVVLAPR